MNLKNNGVRTNGTNEVAEKVKNDA